MNNQTVRVVGGMEHSGGEWSHWGVHMVESVPVWGEGREGQ